MADHVFHLVLFISVDQVRGWPREVGAMSASLAIRGQQGCVEDVMDGPGLGKVELISHG
jgi:hypothetical protein